MFTANYVKKLFFMASLFIMLYCNHYPVTTAGIFKPAALREMYDSSI